MVWALPVSLAATQGMMRNFLNLLSEHALLINAHTQVKKVSRFVSFPPLTEMFHFSGFAPNLRSVIEVYSMGLPHSEILGSPVATHLPETYRRYATSFIAF